jgi:branched-chain amino acid transport system permease protein
MTTIIQHIIDALTLGSIYALLGLGIALVFGIMRLINFAHGELIMVSAYLLVLVGSPPWPVLILLAILVPVIFGLAMERIAFRPVRGASEATLLVTSFAVSFLLQNLALLIFGATPKTHQISTVLGESFTVGGLTVPKLSVVTVVATITLLGGLSLFFARSRLGVQMRAAAEDFQMARILGVRANVVIASAFGISGALAGVAAMLLVAQSGTATPSMGAGIILIAFVGTVLGGMGSLSGAVLGGFLLAAMSVALDAYLPAELRVYRDAFAFGAVILVLLYRPQGLIVPKGLRTRV